MIRIVLIFACAAFGLCLPVVCLADIAIRPSQIDMGRVHAHSVPVCFIDITNKGIEKTSVASVETSDNLHIVAELLGEKEILPNVGRRIRVSVYSLEDSNDALVRVTLASGAVHKIPLKWHYGRLGAPDDEQGLSLMKVDEKLSIKAMRISPEVLDLGTVDAKTRKACKFLVSNTAKKEIYLRRAFSSCGCTVIDFKPQKLAPGKTVQIEYFLDASEKYRHFKVPVFVEGALENALLRRSAAIKGFKEVYYEFLPKRLSFSDSQRSQRNSSNDIVVKPSANRNISIVSTKSDHGYVSFSIVESPETIKVRCTPKLADLGRGIWEDVVRIELDISKAGRETISIPVTMEKEGELAIMPKRVFYGFVGLEKKYSKSVTVQSRTGEIRTISLLRKPQGLDLSFEITRMSLDTYRIECLLHQMSTASGNVIKDEICFLVDEETYCIPVYAIFTKQ